MLIDGGVGVKAPYLHRSWVNLPRGTSEDELGLVRSSMTKKVQAELDPFELTALADWATASKTSPSTWLISEALPASAQTQSARSPITLPHSQWRRER
jgi:hypothetical protein